MSFYPKFGGESAPSKDVSVRERGVAFSAYEGWAVFLLHLWMCTPHATSSESLQARKGGVEYACMVWSDPVVLASRKICM